MMSGASCAANVYHATPQVLLLLLGSTSMPARTLTHTTSMLMHTCRPHSLAYPHPIAQASEEWGSAHHARQ